MSFMSTANPESAFARVRTYPLPPAGFDARTVSPLELRRYGLPQRPDASQHPELASLWDRVFSRKLTYITPTFQPIGELLPGVQPRGHFDPALSTFTTLNWSGCVVHAAANQKFTWVHGVWNVPDVQPPAKGQGLWYSFAWIGIGKSNIAQIGTVQYVSTDKQGNVSTGCYAAFEWWPNNWTPIGNFPVNFGDTVNGLICLQSATEASANLVNVTTGLSVSFDFSAPSGMASDDEDQVEWIMELPGYSGANPQLPNFGEIYFDSALGGGGLDLVVNAGTDTVLNLGASNAIVATTTVETPTLIKIAYVPLTMTIEVTAPSFPGSIGVGDTETGELVISATFKAVVTFPSPSPEGSFHWAAGDYTVGVNAPVSVPISFTPRAPGTVTEILELISNAQNGPTVVTLQGVGKKGITP